MTWSSVTCFYIRLETQNWTDTKIIQTELRREVSIFAGSDYGVADGGVTVIADSGVTRITDNHRLRICSY